jgi:hypothetical protein
MIPSAREMALFKAKRLSRLARLFRFCGPGLALVVMLVVRAVRADAPVTTTTTTTHPTTAASSNPTTTTTPTSTPTSTPTTAPGPGPGSPKTALQKVTVGLYLQNIPEIDIKTNSFSAEFYLWFLWEGDIDPTLTYELTNVVNISELTKVPIFVDAAGASAPDTLPDGRRLQQFHVYGRFGHPFPLGKYPFDDHEIVISLEDARHASTVLMHEIDVKGTAMRPDLSIPGWNLSPMQSKLGLSKFATTFGDPRSGGNEESYSRVEFKVHIDRPVVGIFSKTVVPIALIIIITFGAFFLQPSDIDARLCLTITALISAVALQFTAATELPPTGALLLLDQIYILSYVAILAVTFACIGANRYVHAERPESAARTDKIAFRAIALGYFGLLALFLWKAQ